MFLSLFRRMSRRVAVLTEKVRALLAMQNSRLLLAESTQAAEVVLGLIDPQRDHQLLLLVLSHSLCFYYVSDTVIGQVQ